jgi:hypothetical protein
MAGQYAVPQEAATEDALMMLNRIFPGFGMIVAAMLSLAFLLAPMASAQHVELAPDEICAAEAATVHVGGGEDHHDGHAHHVHGCGACHVHLIGSSGLPAMAIDRVRSNVRPMETAGCGASPPGELFRPPRI